MKRKIALCLLAAVLANPALAINLDANSVTALKNAGVTDSQLNQIEASIANKESVTKEQLSQAMSDAGVTPAQMQTLSRLTPTVATGGGTAAGLTAGMTVAASVGLAVVIAAAAVAVNDAVNNDNNSSGTVKP